MRYTVKLYRILRVKILPLIYVFGNENYTNTLQEGNETIPIVRNHAYTFASCNGKIMQKILWANILLRADAQQLIRSSSATMVKGSS
jgi:hypothetical protein